MTRRPGTETERLRALASYAILDTPPEAAFDDISRLAAILLDVPSAAISLVDDRRQWLKSRVGTPLVETPRSHALCAHAVASGSFLEVADASRDPRFARSPLVAPTGGIRFYAGAPLIVDTGHCLGTLCAFDTVPRAPLSADRRWALRYLADLAVERIEARRGQMLSEIAASVVAATSDAVLAVGRDGLISFWNPGAERMFGHAAADALGSTLDLILPPHLARAHHAGFAKAAAGGATSLVGTTVELCARRGSGEQFPIELSLARFHDGGRESGGGESGGGFAAIVRDISSRKGLERDRADARLFLDTIVDHLPEMLFVKDGDSRKYLLFNKAGETLVGMSADEVVGRTDEELFPGPGSAFRARDSEVLGSRGVETYESDFTRADGRSVTLRTKRIVVAAPGDDRTYLLGLSEDVTELRRSERQLLHLAHHDSLTGLRNRASLVERLEALVAAKTEFAILTIDLDRFKAVNDQFGHPTGDALLVEAAARLRGLAAPEDIVARIGGDEFVLVALGAAPDARAAPLAEAVLVALARPYAIGGFVAHAGASIGVVRAPADGADVEALRQAADLALYRAKANGRGGACFFSGALDEEAGERRMLARDLRSAIEQDEIRVAFQPIVSCETGQVTSFEALARWTHPSRGAVNPATFIAIAEESGLVGRLGESVLRQACDRAAHWPETLKVAVNLSPLQFESGGLVALVESALAASGLPCDRLQLEVTEGLLIRNVEDTLDVLAALRALGVQILLDDFGTGFSSLSYFERFPFDKVKIDQSFVRKMATTPAARAIVQAVIELGRTLDMGIVAEGVETPEQMHMLVAMGCTHLQGFLFSEPRPEEAFAHIVGHGREDAGGTKRGAGATNRIDPSAATS